MTRRAKILFVSESVTLAHVSRPATLASSLDPESFEVHLALDQRYRDLLGPLSFPIHPITSVSTEDFTARLRRGQPVFDEATLETQVREDLRLLREMAPDLVVGDMRLSLSVSARVQGVPYCAIANAYWSPFARQRFRVPELPVSRWVPTPVSQFFFDALRPRVFASHARPMDRVRRRYGLAPLADMRRVYCEGDAVLYADLPQLSTIDQLPANHFFLGPVLWSPALPSPEWWARLPSDREIVYVTLGSSGPRNAAQAVLNALAGEPVTVVAALAGHRPGMVPSNAFVAPFLRGDEAAARASLVICNGGSPTVYQALSAGRPILGIPSNLDQHLCMETVERTGVGRSLRSDRVHARAIRAHVAELLSNSGFREKAAAMGREIGASPAPAAFRRVLGSLLGSAI